MNAQRKPLKRVPTPSSSSLEAVVVGYTASNNELEKSLDLTEAQYPTKQVVRERIVRIEADIARTTKKR